MDNRLVLSNYPFNRSSVNGFLLSMYENGIRRVELCPYASWLDITDRDDVIRFRHLLDEGDVSVVVLVIEQGGVVPFNLALELSDVENWSLEYGKRVVRNMSALGCRKLMISAGRQSVDHPLEEGWDRSVHNLRLLGEEAYGEGVELLICSDGTDTFSNIVKTTNDQIRMIHAIGLPNVKAYADLVSCTASGEDFQEAISILREEGILGHICISDGPEGWLLPGDGGIGASGVRDAWQGLAEINYTGSVTCRLQHWKYDFQPHEATKKLKSFWS